MASVGPVGTVVAPTLRCLARPVGTDQSNFLARIQLKRSIHEEQLLAIPLIDIIFVLSG